MKKIILIFPLIIATVLAYGSKANWIVINSEKSINSEIKLIETKNGLKSSTIHFTLNAYALKEVQTPQGQAYIVETPKGARILKEGAPDLPLYAKSIIVPDEDAMEVVILSTKYIEIPNISVAPSKGNLLRTVNPNNVPYTYGIEYQQNSFYPSSLVYLREPYIMRDYRGQAMVIQPIQYNPITKVLRVYTDIIFEIRSTGIPGINTFQRTKALTSIDREFHEMYKRHFINYSEASKYTPLSDLPGNMLIICHDNFMTAMQPFVNWKIMKGIPTTMVAVSTIGNTSTAIKNYVTNYYNTNGLKYLLLVGDFAQVTSPTANIGGVNGAKDNEYAYVVGNDRYLDFFVGRFSAETTADVQTQVDRTIYYEKLLNSGDWLSSTVGIASSEGPGDDNEYDYQHIRNIQTDLMGFTYTTKYELFDGSQGGLDAPGNPTAANVSTVVNPGTGSIFYTGHGGDTQWVTSGFSNTNVTALTNVNKLPFIYSVACVVGSFNNGTCFCEAWLRAKQTSGPTGAIAHMGSTINQSWNPPMEAHDEMVDILVETYSNNIKRTFAGIGINGCHKMNDTYADYNMTDTWTIFGDPSVMIRTKNPMNMTVSHSSTITVGTTTLDVNCNANGAYVAVTKNNQILGVGYVSNGSVQINLNPAPTNIGDTLIVCATAFNYVTYIGSVVVIANNIPIDAQLLSIVEPITSYYCSGVSVSPKIIMKNSGTQNLTSATINYQIDGGATISQNWTGNLATGQTDTIIMQPFVLTNGNHTFRSFITNPNNGSDGFPSNNEKIINFSVTSGNISVNFTADKTSSCDAPLTVQFTSNVQNVTSLLWNFGDGTTSTQANPSHTYSNLGTYTVTLIGNANICGTYSETKTNYISVGAPVPVIADTTICMNANVTLQASGSGNIQWYDNPSSTQPIATGNTYSLQNVTQNTTVWLNQIVTSQPVYGGNLQSSTNGSIFTAATEHYLVFDCTSPVTLVSVEVNASTAGNRTIQLRNASNTVLQSATVNIPQGISRITLNFNIPAQNDLRLVGPVSPNLWRNNSGCSYPYNIGNVISIKYSSASTNPTGYYYYFYNWEVKGPDCSSAKVPVQIFVSDITLNTSTTNETAPNMNDGTASVTATGNGPFTYLWSNGATTSTITGLTGGTYQVTVTDIYNCTKTETVVVETSTFVNNDIKDQVNIYPNPVNDYVIISYPQISNSKIEVIDANGKILFINVDPLSHTQVKLNVASLAKGVYTIKIYNENQAIIRKLVK
ncbi:MAG: C25 family cysteine peptidase [Bacteroidales bacterium]|nr:C25 family cysteine peptidase [Bacteroidales bacterium]